MKKTLCFVLILSMAVSVLFVSNVSADGNTKTVGYLTFTEHGTYCEVTKCDKSATGDIEIPSSVVFDGKYLPVTEIAGNLTEDYPRYGAFGGCMDIESVTIPGSVSRIGSYAFYECSALKSVILSEGITRIGQYAFSSCDLKSLTVPESITYIEEGAFSNNSDLTDLNLPDKPFIIGQFAFSQSGVTSLNAGRWLEKEHLWWIGLNNVSKISLSDNLKSVTPFLFTDCDDLVFNEYENGLYAGNDKNKYMLFVKPKNDQITSFKLNENTKMICNRAFEGCENLTSITIPDGVRYIGELAFYGCRMEYTVYEGLDYLGSKSNPYYALISSPASPENVTVHEDTKVIADDALIECASAKSLTVSKNNTVYHSKDNCIIKTDDKTLVRGCKNSIIPADGSVTEIGYGAFRYGNGLTDLIIPDSVTSIGLYAFCSCEDLKTVSIGSGLKLIGVQAFSGLNSLEKINYAGSEEEWNDIIILRFNEELINARKEFGAALPEVIPSVPVGDCNFDGSIDNKDVFVLFRYITNEEHADDETVYDFIADGSVDNKDVVALFRYISAT